MNDEQQISAEYLEELYAESENNPHEALKRLIQLPQYEDDPHLIWCHAMAYGSKGVLQSLRRKPSFNILTADGHSIRSALALTEEQLHDLESALSLVDELEIRYPGFVKSNKSLEHRVDIWATVLERCRPGKVQKLLDKTKLSYFGPERIAQHKDISMDGFEFALRTFFSSNEPGAQQPYVFRSAYFGPGSQGTDPSGRKWVTAELFTESQAPNQAGKMNEQAGMVTFFDDGTFNFTASKASDEEKVFEDIKSRSKGSKAETASSAGSWKVFMGLAIPAFLFLLGGFYFVFLILSVAAGAYWWFKLK
jgi:hypothetical protein